MNFFIALTSPGILIFPFLVSAVAWGIVVWFISRSPAEQTLVDRLTSAATPTSKLPAKNDQTE